MSDQGPTAAIDGAHAIIDQCFECESREEIEAKPSNGMGPLARRIFLIWKRDPKVKAALIEVARRAWEEGIDAAGSATESDAERIVAEYLAEKEKP